MVRAGLCEEFRTESAKTPQRNITKSTLGSYLLGRDGGPNIGVNGDFHAEVSRHHGGDGTKDKGCGSESTASVVPSGAGGDGDEDDGAETDNEVRADGVLGLCVCGRCCVRVCAVLLRAKGVRATIAHLKERVSTGVDGGVNLDKAL